MKLSDLIQLYGDIEVPPKALGELGVNVSPCVGARYVKNLTGRDGYRVIDRLKKKYHLDYPEAVISLAILKKEYWL